MVEAAKYLSDDYRVLIGGYGPLKEELQQQIDSNGLQMFLDTLLDLKRTHHMAILLVSHDLRFVREYADHVVLLDKSVLAQGSAAAVFGSPEFSAVFGYSGEEGEAE